MGITSLQVCMDSSDWLQGTIHEDAGIDSSSPSGDILTCSRPLIERRLRPPHDQALKCPRCDSTHTKFCYYNNYSLSQPRYFCKTCRRYWTKGGTLRNIPVGGGCRKNKKVSSKKSNSSSTTNEPAAVNNNLNQGLLLSSSATSNNPTDLHLTFPEMTFPHHHHHLGNFVGINTNNHGNFMLENHPAPIDFIESKYEALMGSTSASRNQEFLGMNGDHNNIGMMSAFGEINSPHGIATNYPSFGMAMDVNNFGNIMDASQRLMLLPPYEEQQNVAMDVKPNPKLLSLEWHDTAAAVAGKQTFGYLGGSWSGLMNGYGSSTTNPLV